jgi:Domain of unknown function (DUF4411)
VFVFDTIAFINGSRHHYFLDTMPGVWTLVEAAIGDGRIVVPREVYRELLAQADEITILIRRHEEAIAEPTERVQRRAGELQEVFPKPGLRDPADPFIMAEAEARRFTVVTTRASRSSASAPRRRTTSFQRCASKLASLVARLPKRSAILAST